MEKGILDLNGSLGAGKITVGTAQATPRLMKPPELKTLDQGNWWLVEMLCIFEAEKCTFIF